MSNTDFTTTFDVTDFNIERLRRIGNTIARQYYDDSSNDYTALNNVDAYRHAYTSAVLTYKYGLVSDFLGNLNELATSQTESDAAHNQAYWNNAIGREIGVYAKENHLTLEDIEELVKDAVDNGDTISDLNDDNRKYPDDYDYSIGENSHLPDPWYDYYPDSLKGVLKYWQDASNINPVRIDPLLIDLDGDGIETTTASSGVFFDHESDGFAEESAWVGEDDGILVIDKNNNGTIDNGTEIFGDNYMKNDGTVATSGFDAISDLDSNSDGVINSSDTNFNDIKVLKGDGSLLSLHLLI